MFFEIVYLLQMNKKIQFDYTTVTNALLNIKDLDGVPVFGADEVNQFIMSTKCGSPFHIEESIPFVQCMIQDIVPEGRLDRKGIRVIDFVYDPKAVYFNAAEERRFFPGNYTFCDLNNGCVHSRWALNLDA